MYSNDGSVDTEYVFISSIEFKGKSRKGELKRKESNVKHALSLVFSRWSLFVMCVSQTFFEIFDTESSPRFLAEKEFSRKYRGNSILCRCSDDDGAEMMIFRDSR